MSGLFCDSCGTGAKLVGLSKAALPGGLEEITLLKEVGMKFACL